DRPVVRQAQFATDLVHQEGDLVAHPTGAITAEIRQVLAHLGGIDTGEFGEALAADVLDAFVGLLAEDAQIHGETGDRFLGDSAASTFDWHAPLTLGTRAHVHKAGSGPTRDLEHVYSVTSSSVA